MPINILGDKNLELAVATLSCIGDGVISTDLDSRIIYMNRIAEEILEWEAKDALGNFFDKVFLLFDANTRIVLPSPLTDVLELDTPRGFVRDTIIITENGSQKYISATCSPVKSAAGITMGVVVVFRDITRLRALEIEHLSDKNNLQTIFDYAPVGMITLNEATVISQINDAALIFTNKDKEEVLEKSFGQSINCLQSMYDEKGCGYGPQCPECDVRKAIALAINAGKATSNIEFNEIISRDNQLREFWFRASITPIVLRGKRNAVVTLMDISESKRREISVAKSRDFINNILDQIPSLVWKADESFRLDYVNKSWRDFTGLNLGDGSDDPWTKVIHPGDLDTYEKFKTEAKGQTELFQLELRLRRFDGEYRNSLFVGTPYYDLDGQYAGYIGTIYDITRRKEVIKSLNRYKMLAENSGDIMLFVDLEGKIIEANKAAIKAYGYTYEELHSLNVRDILGVWSNTSDQMEQPNHLGTTFETIHRRKDGSRFEVEVSSQTAMLEGKQIILKIIRDITERREAARKLFRNRVKYRTLFMNMHSAYAYYRLHNYDQEPPGDLIFVEVNEAYEKISGLTKKHLIGKHYSEVFPTYANPLTEVIRNHHHKLMRGERIYLEETYIHAFKKWCSAAIYSPDRKHIVAILTDISPLKQSEIKLKAAKEAAEAASRAKSEFLANMSHEIRTPLNGMVGMVDLTLLTELNADQRDNLLTAKNCANSLLKIINDILDFSKMEAGKLSFENLSFNLHELIGEIIKTHSPRIRDKGLEFNYTISSTIPKYLSGDPHRLRQIINNLISNAIKFTNYGGISLTVQEVRKEKDLVNLKFLVSDTGIGIAPKDLGLLFNSFSQIDRSFTKKFGGTGLGLAISKKLTETMGGTIGVKSEKGQGSTFFFSLSFAVGGTVEEKTTPVEIVKTINPLNILLVEDDPVNQKVIIKMLEEKGDYVKFTNNGQEGLDLFAREKFDLVLMDIQMPEMDGIKAMRRMREVEAGGVKTPVIAITAYALPGDRDKLLALGMDGYLAKPIQMSELFDLLDRIRLAAGKGKVPNPDKVLLTENGEICLVNKVPPKSPVPVAPVLNRVEGYLKALEEAMESNDFMMVELHAQKIKTISLKIDDDELKALAFKVQLASRRSNSDEVLINVQKIKAYLEAIKKVNILLKE